MESDSDLKTTGKQIVEVLSEIHGATKSTGKTSAELAIRLKELKDKYQSILVVQREEKKILDDLTKTMESNTRSTFENIKAWQTKINGVVGGISSLASPIAKLGTLFGGAGLGLKASTDAIIKYDKSMFQLSKTQQIYGRQAKETWDATYKSIGEGSVFSKNELLSMQNQFNKTFLGTKPSTLEFLNLQKMVEKSFGGNKEAAADAMTTIAQMQSEYPALGKEIIDYQNAVKDGNMALAESLKENIEADMRLSDQSIDRQEKIAAMMSSNTADQDGYAKTVTNTNMAEASAEDAALAKGKAMESAINLAANATIALNKELANTPVLLNAISLVQFSSSIMGQLGVLLEGAEKLKVLRMFTSGGISGGIPGAGGSISSGGAGGAGGVGGVGGGIGQGIRGGLAGGLSGTASAYAGSKLRQYLAPKEGAGVGNFLGEGGANAAGTVTSVLGGAALGYKTGGAVGAVTGAATGLSANMAETATRYFEIYKGIGKAKEDALAIDKMNLESEAKLLEKKSKHKTTIHDINKTNKDIVNSQKDSLSATEKSNSAHMKLVSSTSTIKKDYEVQARILEGIANSLGNQATAMAGLGISAQKVAEVRVTTEEQAYQAAKKASDATFNAVKEHMNDTKKLAGEALDFTDANSLAASLGAVISKYTDLAAAEEDVNKKKEFEGKIKTAEADMRDVMARQDAEIQGAKKVMDAKNQSATIDQDAALQRNDLTKQDLELNKLLAESIGMGAAQSMTAMQDLVNNSQKRIEFMQQSISNLDKQMSNFKDKQTGQSIFSSKELENVAKAADPQIAALELIKQKHDAIAASGKTEKEVQIDLINYAQKRRQEVINIKKEELEQLNLTKKLREGYLSALEEMSVGAGEFSEIISNQSTGVSEIIKLAQQVSGEGLGTFAMGGTTQKGSAAAASRGQVTAQYAPFLQYQGKAALEARGDDIRGIKGTKGTKDQYNRIVSGVGLNVNERTVTMGVTPEGRAKDAALAEGQVPTSGMSSSQPATTRSTLENIQRSVRQDNLNVPGKLKGSVEILNRAAEVPTPGASAESRSNSQSSSGTIRVELSTELTASIIETRNMVLDIQKASARSLGV